jgi:hypothetical protein
MTRKLICMGAKRAVRVVPLLLVVSALLGAAGIGTGPRPIVPAPISAPVAPESLPAIALSHRAEHLKAALLKGDPEAVRSAQLEVEVLRRSYSTMDVTPLIEAMAFWARQQGSLGKPALGLAALQAVERWATDHPTILGTRIILMRQEGLKGWLWSFPDLLRLTRIRLDHPVHRWLWLIQHLGMLRLMATMLLWGWALAMALRYRNVLRNLWEEALRRRPVPPRICAFLGALLLTAPVLVGLDPSVAAILWLFLLAPFLLVGEVKATVFILLLQLVHPALAALEPWAAREPEPSVLMLQLQPQVMAATPVPLSRLAPTDQTFLQGWSQLQAQDWKGAATTFESLVGRHPEQAQVLNNLGVARFQSGDGAGADKAFELALVASPKMEILLNQSILAFNRLDTALGASKRDEAQAVDPDAYARLIELNDAQKEVRVYPMPLPDTPERVAALRESGTVLGSDRLPLGEPAFLWALFLPLLGLGAFLARVRASIRMAHPAQCVRCGEPFHTTDSADPNVCGKCHHLFVLRDGLHTENRRKKLDEVAEHQRNTRWIHKTLVVILPGCDLTFLGETREGLLEFVPFCLTVGMVVATGRSVRYPGEILADPASIWLAIGAVLMVMLYLRSWLKLILRRA